MPALVDFLMSVSYFATLSNEEIKQLEKESRELSFTRGESIFLEGEPCSGLYVVKSGQIRLFRSSPDGREQVIFIAKPRDTFNEVAVFDSGPNLTSATAVVPSIVYLIPKGTLLSLIADSPAALAVIRVFTAQLRHLTSLVEDLSFRNVVSRLAKLLLELAVAEEDSVPVPQLTKDEMAARIGSVRDVVSRALWTLQRAGSIEIKRRRITVIDPEKLREMS